MVCKAKVSKPKKGDAASPEKGGGDGGEGGGEGDGDGDEGDDDVSGDDDDAEEDGPSVGSWTRTRSTPPY